MNISSRSWKTYKFQNYNIPDFNFTYNLKKHQIGNYLNIWFKSTRKHEFVTLKLTDIETTQYLYGYKYNTVTVGIESENLKVQIHSIDDSSFSILLKSITNAKELQLKIMEYISSFKALNGLQLMEYCKTFSSDYEEWRD